MKEGYVLRATESLWKIHSSFLDENAAISNTLLVEDTAPRKANFHDQNLSLTDFNGSEGAFVIVHSTVERL